MTVSFTAGTVLHTSGMLCNADWQLVTGISGQSINPIFWPLKIGPISYPGTLVTNCQSMLRNIPKEPRSYLYCGRSLKSCTLLHLYSIMVQLFPHERYKHMLIYFTPKLLETCDGDVSFRPNLHVAGCMTSTPSRLFQSWDN